MYSLLIISCHSNKYVTANKIGSGFFVNLYQNELNGFELNLVLEAKSTTQNIDFKCEEYSEFKVIFPNYKRTKYNRKKIHNRECLLTF